MPNITRAFRGDPTRTLTLRKKYESELYKRFRKLKGDVRKSIVTNDVFGLVTNQPLNTRQFAFERDPEKVRLFLEWLQKQIDNGILEVYYGTQLGSAIESLWANVYIRTSYEKGVQRAQNEMKNAGYQIPRTATVITAMNLPIHIDRLGLLYTRNYAGLKGITDEMSKQIAEILTESIALGRGPREVANLINDRIDKIGITRARTLARTEMIRAHHQAMIQEMKNWGVVGVRVLAEWVTAGDGRVCPICRPLDGKVYTLEKAENMIPRHPGCVTGDSVIMAPDIKNMMKIKYSGPIVKITLSNGSKVSVSPNHMFMTPDGFVMARFLSNSDYLLYSTETERKIFVNPNYDRNIARIDNVVKSFSESFGMSTERVPLATEDLHGDGVFCDKKIDIINTTSFLVNRFNTKFMEFFSSNNLSSGSILNTFTSFGSFSKLFFRNYSSFGSDVSLSREFFAFFRGCLLKSNDVSLTPISGLDIMPIKTSDYNIAANSKFFSKFFDGVTIVKKSDNFIIIELESVYSNIRSKWKTSFDESIFNSISFFKTEIFSNMRKRFSGHVTPMKIVDVSFDHLKDSFVYDVETLGSIYNVNGVLSSNCRCMVIPLDVTDNKKLMDKVKRKEAA